MTATYPWQSEILRDWMIAGMNHYRQDGERRLFVSMTLQDRCILAEGADEAEVWARLEAEATRVRRELEELDAIKS